MFPANFSLKLFQIFHHVAHIAAENSAFEMICCFAMKKNERMAELQAFNFLRNFEERGGLMYAYDSFTKRRA